MGHTGYDKIAKISPKQSPSPNKEDKEEAKIMEQVTEEFTTCC